MFRYCNYQNYNNNLFIHIFFDKVFQLRNLTCSESKYFLTFFYNFEAKYKILK